MPTVGAFVLNATVLPTMPFGYLTLWGSGSKPVPEVSTLNATDTALTSNRAIVPAGPGLFTAYVTDQTYLLFDISGYFAP